jgi:2-polyprenyl-3-methyl-5-hydroxy-6-metoxy-1,4-benzoquinol methylase
MNCRICSSNRLDLVFDLGEQPWGNNFLTKQQLGKEEFYPLQLLYCNECSLSQLSYTVKKEIMFSDHTYLSGSTKSLSEHFKKVCDLLNSRFNKGNKKKSILDIGSNDGTFLQHFKNLDWDILGVESSKKISEIANNRGINTIHKFFNLDTAKDINSKFDFINASLTKKCCLLSVLP